MNFSLKSKTRSRMDFGCGLSSKQQRNLSFSSQASENPGIIIMLSSCLGASLKPQTCSYMAVDLSWDQKQQPYVVYVRKQFL
jgi:hypothetical protein